MPIRAHAERGTRYRARGTALLAALLASAFALACGPPQDAPTGLVIDTVEVGVGFDEPVYVADAPAAAVVTSLVLPPGEEPGVFEGSLGVEDTDGHAADVTLRVQVE